MHGELMQESAATVVFVTDFLNCITSVEAHSVSSYDYQILYVYTIQNWTLLIEACSKSSYKNQLPCALCERYQKHG